MAEALDFRRLSRWPLMVAPMGGGPSTPALVTAAAEAGAIGFLAAADDPDGMSLWAGVAWRSATDRPAGEIVELLATGVPTP